MTKNRTDATKDIIRALQEKKEQLELSNAALARRMGISRSAWTMISRGDRNIGIALLAGIARTFPDLNDLILVYLRSVPPVVTHSSVPVSRDPVSPEN